MAGEASGTRGTAHRAVPGTAHRAVRDAAHRAVVAVPRADRDGPAT
ncbi:MAG TPA: hypothetical protein VGH99_03455 [Pseudonocardia sp.]